MQRVVRFWFPFQTLLVATSLFLYLGYSQYYGGLGFPLDDSWIHQTFARNLALFGQWAYNPGEVSAGSTSPLWTIILAPGYLLPIEYRGWTYLLGAIFLSLTGWIARRLYLALFPRQETISYLLGLLLSLEWHLVWAAFSGMETILFVFLSLFLVERHLKGSNPFFLGVLGGLLGLTRPEGIILLSLVALDRLRRRWKSPTLWGKELAWLLCGFALLLVPYLAFHLLVTGHPLPNTFYAKRAEYLDSFAPLWVRLVQLPGVTLVGAQILLLPGLIWTLYQAIREKKETLLLLTWWATFLLIYIFYLPLAYQHGRYLMPTIPIMIILGLGGTVNLSVALTKLVELLKMESGIIFILTRFFWRVARAVFALSTPLLLVRFWFQGARAYATDVSFIERELVDVAHWLREETAPGAIVATHDIGALGYFSQRSLVDIAGLASPEVIPFIDDEERLLAYLEEKQVEYLVTFPSWYPTIVASPDFRLIYRTDYPWTVTAGFENNAVYETLWQECRER